MMSEEQKDTSDEKGGIKPSQVTAAALAAVTAAFLGSTLGVAGTVAGAGIASVVSTVGGELYLRSLSKTKAAAQRTTAAALALADSSTREQAGQVQQPQRVPGPRMVGYQPTAQDRAGLRNGMRPGAGAGPRTQWQQRQPAHHRAPGANAGRTVDEVPTVFIPRLNPEAPVETGAQQARRRYSLHWPLIIGTSVVGFVIAILAITGFEGVTGKSISGDEVTTVGHIWSGVGGGQPDKPPTGGDENVAPSQTRVPTTTTPPSSTDSTKRSTTNSSTPSTSVPESSTPSTTVPESSTPSTTAPKSNSSRAPGSPPSNGSSAPSGSSQRPGSDGASEAPRPNVR
ncbi:hypothetical protein ACFWF7_14765 [Nocardia sp. NPDC060256]|uniref:hypothetical protein n=1 Tax=unclassified Nocardia TaxID=2637762 RepID=UPI003650F347